jgi:hypothetical protein
MGQQQDINLTGVKTKILPVLFIHFPAALVHAAVDKNTFVPAADKVTGSGYITVCAVKFKLHGAS